MDHERDRIQFRHPMIRSAAYRHPDPARRRAAHGAHASAARTDERAAWHLAAASASPDETVAAQLEAVGEGALARSAYAAAGGALQAAATLSPGDDDRVRRTIGAGRALWLGGESERAAAVLEGVLDLAVEPRARADVQQFRAAALLFMRPLSETSALLVAEVERVRPHDGVRAGRL